MINIITLIKKWLTPNKTTAEEILSKMELTYFYGSVGDEIYYYNPIIKQPILTIKVKSNSVKIYPTNRLKMEYINNIGILELSKKEKIRLYQLVEDWMLDNIKKEQEKAKQNLLKSLGLTENEFAFLVDECKYENNGNTNQ